MTFTTKTYDVACILPKTLCCVVQTLNLLPNEVEFHSNCCYGFTQISRRVPYGELAGIEKIKCCWFSSFKAGALTSKTEKGAEVPFCPGTGFEEDYVSEIVEELKLRQYHRGDAAKMRRIEQSLRNLRRVEDKLDVIMRHMNLSLPDSNVPMATEVDSNMFR